MATINHNGEEYEYDPHAVRVAVDCKVCWYEPIIERTPYGDPIEDMLEVAMDGDPEVDLNLLRSSIEKAIESGNPPPQLFGDVYTGMVVYDGIEKEIKYYHIQPSLDGGAVEGDTFWDTGMFGGFMEYLTQCFLPNIKLEEKYNSGYGFFDLDCTIPIDDDLDSNCVFEPIIDWGDGHDLVYIPPGTTEVIDPYWKMQESQRKWEKYPTLPSIFDLYFSEYKFTCPGWDEDDTLRVIDVLFQPLCDRYLCNEEVFEYRDGMGDITEYIAGWLDFLEAMPRASIKILNLLHSEAHSTGRGEDMNMLVDIIHPTASHLQILFPELYAEYLGPEAKKGRHCRWDHTMRKPTSEEHESLTNDFDEIHRVCGECVTDFAWNAEWEDGYWHCFDCHRNAEPEYDNHMCHNCGMEQGVLNLLRAVQASETEN